MWSLICFYYFSDLPWHGGLSWCTRRNFRQHRKPGLFMFIHPWFYVCMFVRKMQREFSSICVNERLVQVNNAVDHVQRGTSALQNAKKLQKNSRKWMCIAIIILLLIVAIIVVGVIQPWKNNKGAWVWHISPLFIYMSWVGWENHLHVCRREIVEQDF